VTKRPMNPCGIALCLFIPTMVLAQAPPVPADPIPALVTPAPRPDPAPITRPPVFVGKGVTVRTSVGYAYMSLSTSSSNRVNLSGVDAAATVDLSLRLGVSIDSSYVRASNVLNTGWHSDVLSYLAGPVFYPTRSAKLTTYVHGLVGGARVTGAIPESGGGFELGYVNKLSWVLGAGVEYQVWPSFAFRIGGDYQHTYFYNADVAIRGQNGIRVVCSAVYVFWQHPERRR
jgi:opacity protein-like surface antigen